MTERAQAADGKKARSYLLSRLRIGSNVRLIPQTIYRYGNTVAEMIGEINLGLAMVEDGQADLLRGPAATPTANTWPNVTAGSTWMPSSGLPAAYTGCGGCRVASPAPGTSGAEEARGDPSVPPGRFLVAGWFAT